MHSRTFKWFVAPATAAAAIALIIVSLTVFQQTTPSAYALVQTIEANRGLRYIHVRIDPARGGFEEAWAQLDDQGKLLRLRMSFPDTEDGPKDVVWEQGKAEIWFKAKKSVGVVHEPNMVNRMGRFFQMCDPNVVTNNLYAAQAAGEVKIETKLPVAIGAPIVLVATSLGKDGRQEVYHIDPATKLVQRVEYYQLQRDQYVLGRSIDYLEYNQPADPAVFVLNTPDGVMRIDETTQVIGLPKGDLTDEQITVQVVREFFEALIAKDYAKAGQLLGGLPESRIREIFGKMKVLRIVSIGEPKPQPIPGVGGMVVPCEVEIEVDGKTVVKEFNPAVRPVYSQRDRWNIHGGI